MNRLAFWLCTVVVPAVMMGSSLIAQIRGAGVVDILLICSALGAMYVLGAVDMAAHIHDELTKEKR